MNCPKCNEPIGTVIRTMKHLIKSHDSNLVESWHLVNEAKDYQQQIELDREENTIELLKEEQNAQNN